MEPVATFGAQQPSAFVGTEAQLPPHLAGRDAVRVGSHQIRRPETHTVSGSFEPCITVSAVTESLSAALGAFVGQIL